MAGPEQEDTEVYCIKLDHNLREWLRAQQPDEIRELLIDWRVNKGIGTEEVRNYIARVKESTFRLELKENPLL